MLQSSADTELASKRRGYISFKSTVSSVRTVCLPLITVLCIPENKAEKRAVRCGPWEGTGADGLSCPRGPEIPSVLPEGAAADASERRRANHRGQQHSRQPLQRTGVRVLQSWACCCQLGVRSGQDDLLIDIWHCVLLDWLNGEMGDFQDGSVLHDQNTVCVSASVVNVD